MPPQTLAQALSQRIRELCKQERWSQRELAKRLGVSQGAVSYLLADKRRAAGLDYYERVAGIFGMPLSMLIADLEQRVSHEGRPSTIVMAAAEGEHPEFALVRMVLQTLLDAQHDAAHRVDARVAKVLKEHVLRQVEPGALASSGTSTVFVPDAPSSPGSRASRSRTSR